MIRKMDLGDIYLVFLFPAIVGFLAKLLDTWIISIVFGFFGILYLIGFLYNKKKFANESSNTKEVKAE